MSKPDLGRIIAQTMAAPPDAQIEPHSLHTFVIA